MCNCNKKILLTNSEPINNDSLIKIRNHEICFEKFTDKRIDSLVGHTQNGYKERTSNIMALNDVSEWINNEIEIRLKNAGYKISHLCKKDQNNIMIKGQILKVYTTANLSYLGEVTVQSTIGIGENELLKKDYSCTSKLGTNWGFSDYPYKNILEKTLSLVIDSLIIDIQTIDTSKSHLLLSANINENDFTRSTFTQDNKQNIGSGLKKLECPKNDGEFTSSIGKGIIFRIKLALDSIKYELKSIFKDRSELNNSLGGSICVTFEISTSGNIGNVQFIHNTLNDKLLENKFLYLLTTKKIRNLEKVSETIAVSYRLDFKPITTKTLKTSHLIATLMIVILGTASFFLSFS